MKPILLSSVLDTNAAFLYKFFLDSKLHSAVTGSKAVISGRTKGRFTAWDGYIQGETVSLEKNKRIIQKWRTTEFSETDKDSTLEITMEEMDDGKSKLTLKHSGLPKGTGAEYKKGWEEFYIKPLKEYIRGNS